jgi:hypothetical protein
MQWKKSDKASYVRNSLRQGKLPLKRLVEGTRPIRAVLRFGHPLGGAERARTLSRESGRVPGGKC